MGCSFCNGLLPPCFLVWKTCLTQRASETSILPLKRIQVSPSRCFPVKRHLQEKFPPCSDEMVSFQAQGGAGSVVQEHTWPSHHLDTDSAPSVHPSAPTGAPGGHGRLGEHPRASPPLYRSHPAPAQPCWAPRGKAKGRDGTGEPQAGSILPPGSHHRFHGDPAHHIGPPRN